MGSANFTTAAFDARNVETCLQPAPVDCLAWHATEAEVIKNLAMA